MKLTESKGKAVRDVLLKWGDEVVAEFKKKVERSDETVVAIHTAARENYRIKQMSKERLAQISEFYSYISVEDVFLEGGENEDEDDEYYDDFEERCLVGELKPIRLKHRDVTYVLGTARILIYVNRFSYTIEPVCDTHNFHPYVGRYETYAAANICFGNYFELASSMKRSLSSFDLLCTIGKFLQTYSADGGPYRRISVYPTEGGVEVCLRCEGSKEACECATCQSCERTVGESCRCSVCPSSGLRFLDSGFCDGCNYNRETYGCCYPQVRVTL